MNAALLRDDSGATMVEYAIMLAFIAGICIALVRAIGINTVSLFNSAAALMGWR